MNHGVNDLISIEITPVPTHHLPNLPGSEADL